MKGTGGAGESLRPKKKTPLAREVDEKEQRRNTTALPSPQHVIDTELE
jgi:hypothetical protein